MANESSAKRSSNQGLENIVDSEEREVGTARSVEESVLIWCMSEAEIASA